MIENEDLDGATMLTSSRSGEEKFLRSMAEQWEECSSLSQTQRAKIEDIFNRVSMGGRDGGRSA